MSFSLKEGSSYRFVDMLTPCQEIDGWKFSSKLEVSSAVDDDMHAQPPCNPNYST